MEDRFGYQKRLSDMIVKDKEEAFVGIDKLIRSEILNVLKNYFIISNDDLEIEFLSNCSNYELSISAKTKGVKKIKKII